MSAKRCELGGFPPACIKPKRIVLVSFAPHVEHTLQLDQNPPSQTNLW